MSNDDQVDFIDVQQLNCKMATVTTSSAVNNSIQNSITEHVLSNGLTNFVTNNKLNLDGSHTNGFYQLDKVDAQDTIKKNGSHNSPQCKLNDLDCPNLDDHHLVDDKLTDGLILTTSTDDRFISKANGNDDSTITLSNCAQTNLLLENGDDELFLITNPSTISLFNENLDFIRSDYFTKQNTSITNSIDSSINSSIGSSIDLNNNAIDALNNNDQTELNCSAQQLKEIFSSIRHSISTNPKTSTSFSFLTNCDHDTKLTNCTTKDQDTKPTNCTTTKDASLSSTEMTKLLIEKNLLFNRFYNSTGDNASDKLDESSMSNQQQFNNNNDGQCALPECNQFNTGSNQISKLVTDDYLTEHDYNYLINTNLQPVDNQMNTTNSKQIRPMMNHHKQAAREANQDDDDDDEIYEDIDDALDREQQSTTNKLNRQSNDRSSNGDCVDVETMKTHLAKLKLSKDLDSLNSLNNSPLDELNDDNDYYDAIDEEIDRTPLIRSTSLKTSKSKSLGPENQKMVRFADAMGRFSLKLD